MQKQAQIDAFALSWTPFTRQRLDVNAISPHLHLPPLSLPYRTNPAARIACSQWQSLQRAKKYRGKKTLDNTHTIFFFPSVQTERKKKSERKKQINFSSNYVYARAGLARERERERESGRVRERERELASTCHTLHTARDKTTLVPFREKKEKTRVGSKQEVLKPEEILHLD